MFELLDAEFQVELEVTKKCEHQKCPKDYEYDGKIEAEATSGVVRGP